MDRTALVFMNDCSLTGGHVHVHRQSGQTGFVPTAKTNHLQNCQRTVDCICS